jgi:flagellin FlaB
MESDFSSSRREEGSIGIGAMIVFIALILVAAVASTIIIKTAEELQQNAENTSSDTRNQISGKVSILDVFVSVTADELAAKGPDHLKTMDIFVRIASGSIGVQQGDIQYYISCRVTTDINGDGTVSAAENTGGETTVDQVIVESATLTVTTLDGTAVAAGDELTAGTSYKGQITLSDADPVESGTSANEIDSLDIVSPAKPGCDAMAQPGTTLNLRLVVDGGGETLTELKIDSVKLGTSIM